MNANDYLKKLLASEELATDGKELADMDKHKDEVSKLLEKAFTKSTPIIKFGGSRAKNTMNKSSYDLDISIRFDRDDAVPGDTLEEIFENVFDVLSDKYFVDKKCSALRLKSKDGKKLDFHIDVVPGRFTDEKRDDVFIHQSQGDKDRLKTNLEKQVSFIRDSKLTQTIRLAKLWNFVEGLDVKTFVLELLVLKALEGRKDADGLASNLEVFWTYLVDHSKSLCVEDPANSNNDLSAHIDDIEDALCDAAERALEDIGKNDWEAIFGAVRDTDESDRQARIHVVSQAVLAQSNPVKPWADLGL